MKIIALADLHDHSENLLSIGQTLSEVDLVLIVGDLTNNGKMSTALRLVNLVRQFNSSILAVPGNWDGPKVQRVLNDLGINLDQKLRIVGQYAFIGMGASLPCPVKTPNEITELDFAHSLEEAASGIPPDHPNILVCHQPPLRTNVDRSESGHHIGSNAVRAFIEHVQPLICFTGHVHEAKGVDQIGNTLIVNPGPLWQGYFVYTKLAGCEIQTLEIREIPSI